MTSIHPDPAAPAIDPQNPWLGLSSYSEETRGYFHGRDEESAELARRVQRKLLTVLFGQSGLGKTSLLRAGLVPRLRGEGFCPVYVRIDYAPDSPPPAEQIKQAIFRATAASGHWTRPGSSTEGESLWEFLHHRGDLLRDADGRTLLPLLIFDQFEEIFTLAQADDTGRQRAKTFLEDLADLVENRPPAALERRLEKDETDAEQFDFARADYRILIALREDYLAHLEGVKGIMPSITQNRMRLARMTGDEALSAVVEPGGRLVSQEVAESIVRFVAGGAELRNAEVEPSLLSLVCRELNTVRINQGRSEISADLLAGSRETILGEFYERALADQPAGVRRVIEDELLTESGYRESLAEERVQRALAAAGAEPDALAKLVDRRLLRIEERLDVRRVELTHDVLCSVVRGSRDLRQAREARDEAERQLAAQQAREAETQRTLARTRRFAAISAALMLLALTGAAFGWINYRRAHLADVAAQQARADAEKLVGFLIEDFYAELEPTGRVETMGRLAHMAVSYYDGLPPELVTPQTQAYRGMALVREGTALLMRNDLATANPKLDEARSLFESLRAANPDDPQSTYGLALALFARYSAWGIDGAPGAGEGDLQQAADVLRPIAYSPDGAREAKIAYADVLNYLSHRQPKETAVETCEEARRVLADLGALDFTDLQAASVYADTTDSQARHSLALDRVEDAQRLTHEVYAISEKVLAQRPGDLRSMRNQALAADLLSRLAARRHDFDAAIEYGTRSEQAGARIVQFNPSDLSSWDYWIRGMGTVADARFEKGEVEASTALLYSAAALGRDPRQPASLNPQLLFTLATLAGQEASRGNRAAAEDAARETARAADETRQFMKPGSGDLMSLFLEILRARQQLNYGEYKAAFDGSSAAVAASGDVAIGDDDPTAVTMRTNLRRFALGTEVMAALRLGRYVDAESAARTLLTLPGENFTGADPREETSRGQVMLAHAIALQGRAPEAREALAPALAFYRASVAGGAGGFTFERDYAYALYVDARTQQPGRDGATRASASLAEASTRLAGLSAEARRLWDIRELEAAIASVRAD